MIDRKNSGKRIELLYTGDPHTELKPGDMGTIVYERFSEFFGETTISVSWDSGSSLSLLDSTDRYRIL